MNAPATDFEGFNCGRGVVSDVVCAVGLPPGAVPGQLVQMPPPPGAGVHMVQVAPSGECSSCSKHSCSITFLGRKRTASVGLLKMNEQAKQREHGAMALQYTGG